MSSERILVKTTDDPNQKLFFDKGNDTKSVCKSICNTAFGFNKDPNVRMKFSKKEFSEWMEVASFIAMSNMTVYYHELFKACLKENLEPDVIVGEFQLQIKETWDLLATHKYGKTCFKKMQIEDIINMTDPVELLQRSAK